MPPQMRPVLYTERHGNGHVKKYMLRSSHLSFIDKSSLSFIRLLILRLLDSTKTHNILCRVGDWIYSI